MPSSNVLVAIKALSGLQLILCRVPFVNRSTRLAKMIFVLMAVKAMCQHDAPQQGVQDGFPPIILCHLLLVL